MAEDNSFLMGVVSQALAAQEEQAKFEATGETSAQTSGTDNDGYVGDMVRKSLLLLESNQAVSLDTKFPADYIVLVNDIVVNVGKAMLRVPLESSESVYSLRDITDIIERSVNIYFQTPKVYFGKDKQIHIEEKIETDEVTANVDVAVYQKLDANKILRLPLQ